MDEPLYILAVGFGVLAALFLGGSLASLRRGRWMGSMGSGGAGLLLLAGSALSVALAVSTQGYRALTREEVAAIVTTLPTGEGAFQAFVEFPDGRDTTLSVAGDQLLVDAHILKWHPLGNILGLHTEYELDRLLGRYVDIQDEQTKTRTVHSLKRDAPADLFELVRRYTFLAPLVDTEYGSATYLEVTRPSRFEILVSPTGLLIREVDMGGTPVGG